MSSRQARYIDIDTRVVRQAVAYFQDRQLANGAVVDDPSELIFQQWDSVNALKATASWRSDLMCDTTELTDGIVNFLRSQEKPSGMLSWGDKETAATEYCTETSSEYVSALALAGERDAARKRAAFLRTRQLSSGPWAEVHSHIPKAFQTEPSVTGFCLLALAELGLEPQYPNEAVNFLVGAQKPEGHFGINWFYYNTYYYLIHPAVAALTRYGCVGVLGKAREFVLSQQRADGSWFTEVDGFGDYSSAEQHTALALRSLLNAGTPPDHSSVRRAVTWLLEMQRADGSWNGGRYPYPDTPAYQGFAATQHVYTTAQVLLALRKITRREQSDEH